MRSQPMPCRVSLAVPEGLLARMHAVAEKEEMPLSEFIRDAVRIQVRRREKQDRPSD